MGRFSLAAGLAGLAMVASAPAAAEGYYAAQFAAAPSAAKLVVRDTVWNCGASGCVAGRSNSRPEIVCASLAHKLGAVTSFIANGAALSAEQLQRCNARAG